MTETETVPKFESMKTKEEWLEDWNKSSHPVPEDLFHKLVIAVQVDALHHCYKLLDAQWSSGNDREAGIRNDGVGDCQESIGVAMKELTPETESCDSKASTQ